MIYPDPSALILPVFVNVLQKEKMVLFLNLLTISLRSNFILNFTLFNTLIGYLFTTKEIIL